MTIIAEIQMEVNLKSLRQADAKLGPDCNTGETISSIVILPNMFHPIQLQYSLFTPVQQFSILQYTGLGLSRRPCSNYKNTLVYQQRENAFSSGMYRGEPE